MKKYILLASFIAISSICSGDTQTQNGLFERITVRVGASSFALGCVTAIHVANSTDKPLSGDELAVACARYQLTNNSFKSPLSTNIMEQVIEEHQK